MKYLFAIMILGTIAACDTPKCKNRNPVFEKYAPASDEYKAELIRQLNKTGAHNLSYWVDQYVLTGGTEYMQVSIQGDGICALGVLDITGSDRLANYRKVKGMSYHGAELKGLKYRIDSSGGHYNFVFEHVERIVD